MTCREIVDRGCYYRDASAVTLDAALVALHRAGDGWETLPESGEEMCAASDLAVALWALSVSPKVTIPDCRQILAALDAVQFRPSPLWTSPRHAFRDSPELRTLYFILRDGGR